MSTWFLSTLLLPCQHYSISRTKVVILHYSSIPRSWGIRRAHGFRHKKAQDELVKPRLGFRPIVQLGDIAKGVKPGEAGVYVERKFVVMQNEFE
jgi:hypothetical protein